MTTFTVEDTRDGSGNRELFRPTEANTVSSTTSPYMRTYRHVDGGETSIYFYGFGSANQPRFNGWSVDDADGKPLFGVDADLPYYTFANAFGAPSLEPLRELLFNGADSIAGGIAANVLDGLGGADTISGREGADTIDGGDGRSYLRGDEGDDRITGGADFDDINGNMGNDTADGGAGDDWVVGGKDHDRLSGGDGDDIVYGNLGDDTVDGGSGADIVRGGQDADVLFGGAGNDFLSGDRGHDTLTGGTGADTFNSFGDAETDRITDFNLAEGDRIHLEAGTTYEVRDSADGAILYLSGGGRVILEGVLKASLTGDWIVVS